jgi:hypothetical protein
MSNTRSARLGRLTAAGTTLCLTSACLLGAAASPASPAPEPAAHVARTLSVHDEGHLRFTRASGSLLLDEGHASGTFPGWVKARFVYNGEPDVSAQFTISGSGGSIIAHGTGRLSSPTSPDPSFKGALRVTGGTGRYARIHGSGELFGVFNRRSYALTVQAIAKLPY